MGSNCLKQTVEPRPSAKKALPTSPKHQSQIPLDMEESCRIENSYTPIKLIGKGAFGEVVLVHKKEADKYFAMKIIRKNLFSRPKHYEHLNTEKEILTKVLHPFVIKMNDCFQSKERVYFVLDFASGGSLRFHYNKKKKFPLDSVRFYAAEIFMALEYLHSSGYMYRDLKMENILLDAQGHIKLVDFGISKKLFKAPQELQEERTNTFCGTPEYLAPEVRSKQNYNKSVDFWSFGVLLYSMIHGRLPDAGRESTKDSKHNSFAVAIKQDHNEYQNNLSIAEDFVWKLLEVDPEMRLGSKAGDMEVIRQHPFFESIDWDKCLSQELEPPFVPELAHDYDTSYFDRKLTSLTLDEGICQTIVME
ncbi:unnamed protein product [Moneuplotes crassus]|uniref:Uncharacterized protein n=1 Tax=Euplotes crassus TaxID=5936 RepID=A0AAD1XJ67_EUPCR|nr:unnamed protein product [Moneuplotes crassus]